MIFYIEKWGVNTMEIKIFTIKDLLEVIFASINRSAGYFADAYLLKSVSIVSKWKSKKVKPQKEDINKIVEFVVKESTIVEQKTIRDKINCLVNESSLSTDIKEFILCIEDFELFLKETLTIAVSQNSSCFEAVIQEEKNEKDMENIFIAKDNVLLSEDPPDPPENASKVLYEDNDNLYSKPRSYKSSKYINKIKLTLVAASALVIIISFVLFEQLSVADNAKKPQHSPLVKSDDIDSQNGSSSNKDDTADLSQPQYGHSNIELTEGSPESVNKKQEENSEEVAATDDMNGNSSINPESEQISEVSKNNGANAEASPKHNGIYIEIGDIISGNNNIMISNPKDSVISIVYRHY